MTPVSVLGIFNSHLLLTIHVASGFIVIQHCSAEHSGRCGAPLSSLVA